MLSCANREYLDYVTYNGQENYSSEKVKLEVRYLADTTDIGMVLRGSLNRPSDDSHG